MGISPFLLFGVGLLLLFFVGKLFFIPVKFISKLIMNGLVGGILLWIINVFGGTWGISLPLNPVTALLVGFLGIPGVILLAILQYIIF